MLFGDSLFSWLVFTGIVLLAVAGLALLFRSFKRWRQPPPGEDPDAQQAEMKLEGMSKRTGGPWAG